MNLRPGRHERNTFKQIFLSTAAASSLLLAVAAGEPAVFSWATKAEAATNISTSINFYDELAPYGKWVSYHERYVWIPKDVDDSWRPYTKGRWAYTRRSGWIWMSDEKFGWATYHYGRWGKAPDIGWYWLPGSTWAPAWVAWTYDNYDLAWAPLPADYSDDYDGVNIDISFSEIPDDHWQALSVSAFLADDLSSHVFRDRDKVRRVIQRGKPWTVSIENNIVVNTVIPIDNIEKRTKKKVVALKEKAVDNPEAASKADSKTVAIFKPKVKDEPDARPKKTWTVVEVVKEREAKGLTVDYDQTGNAVFGGRGPAGSKVLLYVDNNAYGLAFINDKGTWTFAGNSPLTIGTHTLRADEIGGDGAVKSRLEMPIYREAPKPAEVQTASIEEKKKPEEPANTKRKGKPQCDPAVADCPPAKTLSKPKYQNTNLPGASAESWRMNCSSRFGGFNKASETYLSSAGKRVSCTMRPKNARG